MPTCQPSLFKVSQFQNEDVQKMKGKVDFLLGENMDQKHLGLMHVSNADCTHWLQPGMHDVLAAELGEFLYKDIGFNFSSSSSSETWCGMSSLCPGASGQVGVLAFIGVGCIFCLAIHKSCKHLRQKGSKRS